MQNNKENCYLHNDNFYADHMPKEISTETHKKVAEVLKSAPKWAPQYDRPEDDGQHLLASRTPGSVVAAQKHSRPSRERHSGD